MSHRTMSNNKNPNSPIPTDDVGIAKAGVDEQAGVLSSAPLTLVHPSLPAFNKKPHARSVSAGNVAYQGQYNRAIAMSSAELGKAIKEPTKRITKHLGQAIAHEEKATIARDQAQAEFSENIASITRLSSGSSIPAIVPTLMAAKTERQTRTRGTLELPTGPRSCRPAMHTACSTPIAC